MLRTTFSPQRAVSKVMLIEVRIVVMYSTTESLVHEKMRVVIDESWSLTTKRATTHDVVADRFCQNAARTTRVAAQHEESNWPP